MSGGIEALKLKEEDVVKLLAAGAHLGTSNVGYQMENYVYKRRTDGTHIINLSKTWEKLLVAARVIVNIENPADICVISSRPYGTRAILKFAHHTGATPVAGRFTPGAFTNQIQKAFREPRLLIVCDPQFDHQAVTESSYVNLPVIAFCNTDSPMRYLDVAIPCNNKGIHSIGLMWWMLAREVLRMRGSISRQIAWEIMPDLYFYRDPEEIEKEEQAAKQSVAEEQTPQYPSEWGGATAEQPTEWGAEQMGAPAVPSTMGGGQDWGTSAPPASKDWAESKEWGADTPSKDWGDDLQPSSDWGTSVTMQDANTAGADWA